VGLTKVGGNCLGVDLKSLGWHALRHEGRGRSRKATPFAGAPLGLRWGSAGAPLGLRWGSETCRTTNPSNLTLGVRLEASWRRFSAQIQCGRFFSPRPSVSFAASNLLLRGTDIAQGMPNTLASLRRRERVQIRVIAVNLLQEKDCDLSPSAKMPLARGLPL